MKRRLLLVLFLLIVCFAFADVYTIGTGTVTQNYIPAYGLYDYSNSKSIYTAAEIAAAGLDGPEGLTALGYDVSNTPNNYTFTDQFVYIRHTSQMEYADATMIGSEGFTLVYSGPVTFNGSGWNYLTFTTPFQYDGVSGIEILWENRDGDYQSGYPTFRSTSISLKAAYKYQDGSFPEAGTSGTMSSSRPNLQLVSPQTTPPNPAILVGPADGGMHIGDSVELRWASGGGFPTGYNLYFGTTNPPPFFDDFDSGITSFLMIIDNEPATYYWKVVPENENGEATNCPVWSFNANPEGLVMVGNPSTTTNTRFPFGFLYGYERSAALYTAEELGTIGMIDQIGWSAATMGATPAPYKIYLGVTDVTTFTAQSYDSLIANMTLVKEGSFTVSQLGWNNITLDTPYIYTGGNLIVAVETNFGGGGGSGYSNYHYTTANSTSKHMQWNTDNNPPTTNGTVNANRPNILMHFGELDGDPDLAVSPALINFGDVVFGATVGPRNVMLSNIGGGTLTIAESAVSITGDSAVLFSYDDAVFPIELGSAETAMLPIYFHGTEEGMAEAFLNISWGGEVYTVGLIANTLPEGLVVLGDGMTNNMIPVYPYYGYTYSQMLYMADEIGNAGRQIEKIAFHWNGAGVGNNSNGWQIWMGHTDKNAFASTTDWVAVEDMVLVYAGEPTIPAINQWIEIILPVPFIYNGEDNLVIAVRDSKASYDGSSQYFFSTASTAGRSIRQYSDSVLADPANPPTGTLVSAYANIRMYFGDVAEDAVLSYAPDSINFGEMANGATVGPRNITIINTGGGTLNLNASAVSIVGPNAEEFSFDASVFPFNLETGQSGLIPVSVTGVTEGAISATLVIEFGGEEYEIALSASVLPEGLVIIGDGTTNGYMPVNAYYGYSYAQMLYMADEINTAGRQIEQISYQWNGVGAAPNSDTWEIWMAHTTREAFASTTDWMAISDMMLVYQGFVNIPAVQGWINITLDMPFVYNGTDNLVIAVRETHPSYDSNAYFFYNTASTTGRSIRCQSDTVIPDPATPPTGTLMAMFPNIRMFFGDVSETPAISVAPATINFGTIFNGSLAGPRNVNVFNIGGGTLNLTAADVSIIGDGSAAFSFDDSVFPFALETAESAQIPVYAQSTVEGDHAATLVIEYADEEYEIPLSVNILPTGIAIVGDGTTTARFPWGHLYGYERSAGLYTATEIGGVGMLDQIGWNVATAGSVNTPYKIYAGITDAEAFTAVSFAALTENMTLVKEGEITLEDIGWNMFTLDTPFVYTGGNLIIAVETNYGGSGTGGYPNIYYTGNNTGKHMQWNTDNNPPTTNGTVNANRPNIMMHLGELGGDPELSVGPALINFGDVVFGATVGPRNVMLANIGGGNITIPEANVSITGDSADLFSYDEDVFPIELGSADTAMLPIYFTGSEEGMAEASLNINYGGEVFTVGLIANTLPDGLVIIGDGTQNSYMPVNTFYGYSYAQMLYKADEIQTANRQIEKVAYHWNGAGAAPNSDTWEIWMGHTDKEAFASTTDWIDIDDLTLVYQGLVDIPAENIWIEIWLDTPFVYNGTDNLVIAARETRPSYDTSTYFFYNTASTTGRSIRCQSDSAIPDPATPPTGTLTSAYPNIRMYFADVPTEPVLAVSPNVDEWDFGYVAVYSQATKNFTIANNGAGMLNVNSVSVTGNGFSLQEEFPPMVLASGQSFTVTVVFAPLAAGEYEGALAITSNAGNRTIDLAGICYDPVISQFPFFEGFEEGNTDGSTNINMWTQVDGPEFVGQLWTANSSQTTYNRIPRTGSFNATLRYNGESVLIRPMMLTAGQTYTLEFWARQDAATGATIQAFYGTTEVPAEMTNQIIPASPVVNGDYQQFVGEFTPATSGLYYLGIRGHVTITPWYLSLDDISVGIVYPYEADEDIVIKDNEGDEVATIVISAGDDPEDEFLGAYEVEKEPEELTPFVNPGFVATHHGVWRLIGRGTVTIKITTNATWFAYVQGGVWISVAGPLEDYPVTIDLGSKDSDFEHAFGEGGNPTLPVELSVFTVSYSNIDNVVNLYWKSESESQMLGYRIYRSENGVLADALIVTPSLIGATNTSNAHEYNFVDSEVEDGVYHYWLEAVGYNSSEFYGPKSVSVEGEQSPDLPLVTTMGNAYPNPFKDSTKIEIKVKGGESGTFTIYNMLGQVVFSKKLGEGELVYEWNGKDNRGNRCGSGVYFYKLTTASSSITKKMLIVK